MRPGALRVVCTGKGTHTSTVLTPKITVNEDGSGGWVETPTFAVPDELSARGELRRSDGVRNDVFAFACPRCGRTPELTPDNFRLIVATYVESGVSTLDISHLPF